MRAALIVGLAFAALVLLAGGLMLSSPESELVRRTVVRELHVPLFGDLPVHFEEYEIRVRGRSAESLALLAAGSMALAAAAGLAYTERSIIFRRAVAALGTAYGVGVAMLVATRRDFRTASPILLPLGVAVTALSLALMRLLGGRPEEGVSQRGPSRAPRRPSTSSPTRGHRPPSARRGIARGGGRRPPSAPRKGRAPRTLPPP